MDPYPVGTASFLRMRDKTSVVDADPDLIYHPDADPDADPDSDPDSDFFFDADPDPSFHPDADPVPNPSFNK